MSIELKISSFFDQYTNNKDSILVKGSTVGECINDAIKQLPKLKSVIFDKNGKIYSYLDVFVNGESSFPKQMEQAVKDGDVLHIVMLIHGG
jgi:molybdopterin converting factor small subunit